MLETIDRFLSCLKVERNASQHTLKSYSEDLHSLAGFLADDDRLPALERITPLDLRGYVAALHEAGYAKSSISQFHESICGLMKLGNWAKPKVASFHRRKNKETPRKVDKVTRPHATPEQNPNPRDE